MREYFLTHKGSKPKYEIYESVGRGGDEARVREEGILFGFFGAENWLFQEQLKGFIPSKLL